ncbi:MAG: hypothetical protein QNK37_09055, partial [Acidobacteriota bacterium]|nr:hypothetical protein [Acidobacteriota bacterium]
MNRLKIFLLLGMTAIAGLLTAGEKELKVLFIGNSYTYYHELPAVMARLGADAGWTVEAKHHTGHNGGQLVVIGIAVPNEENLQLLLAGSQQAG